MSTSNVQPSATLAVADPVRAQARRALLGSGAAVALFCAFAFASTQVAWVRAASPWQDDPYDMVVSFVALLVPALALLVAVRVLACRADRPLPTYRLRQILTAAGLAVGMGCATVAADALAALLHADAALWDARTPWLVGALLPVGAATVAGAWLLVRVTRRLPTDPVGTAGDWLDDVVPVLDVVAGRLGGRRLPGRLRTWSQTVAAFVRRHVAAVVVALAAAASAAETLVQAVREGWTSPVLCAIVWVIGTGAYAGAGLAANSVLRVAVPPPSRRGRGPVGAALGRGAVAGGLALPVVAGFRQAIWTALGRPGEITSAEQLTAVTLTGAGVVLAVSALAFLAAALFAGAAARRT